MKNVQKYGKMILLFLGILFLFSLLLTVLNATHILYTKGSDTFIFVGMILILFLIGFFWGRKAEKKGYLEGLKIGGIFIFLLFFINLIFYRTGFSLERLIYYVVLILSSTLGSMLGINKKN